jgi:hypothetical protein
MDHGHWAYPGEFDENEWFGFVYKVINKLTGQQYIGKKQFRSVHRKVVKNRKNRKVIRKDSGWKKYLTSSEYLKNDISQLGQENFEFLIISLHKTKGALTYAEIELQIHEDVLRTKLPSGKKKFYNNAIGNVKFIPPDEGEDEHRHRMCQMVTVIWLNDSKNRYLNQMPTEELETWRTRCFPGASKNISTPAGDNNPS